VSETVANVITSRNLPDLEIGWRRWGSRFALRVPLGCTRASATEDHLVLAVQEHTHSRARACVRGKKTRSFEE
jgi:hypothetical protein